TSSAATDQANLPARISARTFANPLSIAFRSARESTPQAASMRAWASEPWMSCSARRLSKETEAVKRCTNASTGSEKRPDQAFFCLDAGLVIKNKMLGIECGLTPLANNGQYKAKLLERRLAGFPQSRRAGARAGARESARARGGVRVPAGLEPRTRHLRARHRAARTGIAGKPCAALRRCTAAAPARLLAG